MTEDEKAIARRTGSSFVRLLPDGRFINTFPITFGRARVGICSDEMMIDDLW